MSHQALQRIIGAAVTDPEFCTDLLDGRRQTMLAGFDLSAEERNILLTIEASSLQEFASRLEEQLQIMEECSLLRGDTWTQPPTAPTEPTLRTT